MTGTVLTEDAGGGVRVITLNRPQRLNAFTVPMHQALAAAIAEAEHDESCRALLLTGAGRAFSSGQLIAVRTLANLRPRRYALSVKLAYTHYLQRSIYRRLLFVTLEGKNKRFG